MKVRFIDDAGKIQFRTMTRTNVRKIAKSIQAAHGAHPYSHLYAVLSALANSGKTNAELTCPCRRNDDTGKEAAGSVHDRGTESS